MPGDVVLLKEQELSRRTWPLVKVLKTYPGDDGLNRVVDILCSGQTYRRPIQKLVLLVEDGERPASSPREDVQASGSLTRND